MEIKMNEKKFFKAWLQELLFKPMDIAGLAVLRMLFGIILMFEAYRYIDIARLISKYTQADFHFKYMFFEWVQPLSTNGMQAIHIALGLSGFLIFLGIFYHFAIMMALLCISYLFLIDSTNYLNHMYLVIIFTSMMFFIPSYKGWSLYAFFNKNKAEQTILGWSVWLIRFQIGLVYFYAALAKMNVDWINGMPLYEWIGNRLPGPDETYLSHPLIIYFFTYAGLLYDLIIVPLLLYKKTRPFGFMLTLSFHLTNYYLFNIGIFPWFMITSTTIFFDTDWPRNILNFFFKDRFSKIKINDQKPRAIGTWQKIGLGLLAFHVFFQAFFPLRHFFYPGYVSWTEEGHSFAWHMKLRGKSGVIKFFVKDSDTKKVKEVDPKLYLTERQVAKMASRPDMILQFAHFLRDKYTLQNEKMAEVYAETKIRLNGRKPQRLVDPMVNLSLVKPTIFRDSWVFPLRQPVWNAENKKNRFGQAFNKDEIAIRAIHKFDKEPKSPLVRAPRTN